MRGRACLSKTGSARLRRALYLPAVSSLRCSPPIRALRGRLLAAGESKMVILILIVGAAMRKRRRPAVGVLRSGRPSGPDFGPDFARDTPAKA